MAIRFDAIADVLYRDTTLPTTSGGSGFTLAFWVLFTQLTAATLYDALWLHAPTNGFASGYLFVGAQGPTVYIEDGGGIAYTGPALSTNTWYHFGLTVDAANAVTFYLDGVAQAAVGTAQAFTPARLRFGNAWNNNRHLDGRLAAIKVWSGRVLTLGELQRERLQYAQVEPASRVAYLPGLAAADAVTDYSGSGAFTAGGSLTTEDGPPIPWKQGRRRTFVVAGAASDPALLLQLDTDCMSAGRY